MSTTLDIRTDGVHVATTDPNGAVRNKVISLQSLREQLTTGLQFNSGLMPVGTRYYMKNENTEFIMMEKPPQIRHVKWTDGHEYDVPTPWTLWAVWLKSRGGQKTHAWSHVYAMKEALLHPSMSTVYRFPFCNVRGYICWGHNSLPAWDNLLGLQSLADLFFDAPFNGDLDENFRAIKNEAGYDIYGTQSLFIHLNGKTEFPYECLKEQQTFERALRYSLERGR